MNLSKVVGSFVKEHKVVNVQANQKIDTVESKINIVESTLNKKIENLQSNIAKKFDNLQYSIARLTNHQQMQEKGKFPSQTQPNPRGVHEVSSSSEPTPRIDKVKAVITLRSGKQIEQPVLTPTEEAKKREEAEPERILINEDAGKKSTPPPFPQTLKGKKKVIN